MESSSLPSGDIFSFIVLILLSAFFSGSETALFSLSLLEIKILEKEKKIKNAIILKLLHNPRKVLVTILLGNTFVNIALAVTSSKISLELSHKYNFSRSFALSMSAIIITAIIVIFGEITPKNIAYSFNEQISRIVAFPIYFIQIIFTPLINIIMYLVDSIMRMVGFSEKKLSEPLITHQEIEMIFTGNDNSSLFLNDEKDMIEEIFEFEERSVKEIMTPRHKMICISKEASFDELYQTILEEKYSRLPVYDGSSDNIIGVLYVKRLLPFVIKNNLDKHKFDIMDYIQDVVFVPETRSVSELFKDLKSNKTHFAIVVDEYGGTEGLVTFEDIIEEVVGDIFDELDEETEEQEVVKISANEWTVDGSISLNELEDTIGIEDYFEEEEDIVSVSGLLYSKIGHIPEINEKLLYKDLEFTVIHMEGNRIEKVKVCLKS